MAKQSREQHGKSDKRLMQALACSLLLHALILAGRPVFAPVAADALPRVLAVHLTRVPPPSSAEPVSVRKAPAVAAPSPAPVLGKEAVSPVTSTQPVLAVDAPSLGAALPAPSFAPAPSPASTAVAAPVSPSPAPPPVTAEAPAAQAGLDGDGLRAYKLALASQAARFRRYPPQARAAGREGTVEVRLAVETSGLAFSVQVVKSSGDQSLDRAALGMIEAAAARTALPIGLRGASFAVSLPVLFELEER